jgi:hypothetical protein
MFGEMKPSAMWMMDSLTQCNEDLRNTEGCRSLFATSIEIQVSGVNNEVPNLVLSPLCWNAWPQYEIQECHFFVAAIAHTSCRGNHNLLACHTADKCNIQAVSTFANPVHYHLWLCVG